MFKIMYDPNNIVVGLTILFLIGYAFFIIRKMYNKRICELERVNEEYKITNKQLNLELERQYESRETATEGKPSIYDSDFHEVITNVLPKSVSNSLDVIIEDIPYDISEYSESSESSDIKKVVEKIIANTEQYASNDFDEIDEIDEIETVADEIDEVENAVIQDNKIQNKSASQKNIQKDIQNMKVIELKRILDEHGKAYSSDLKKKELREIVLSLSK